MEAWNGHASPRWVGRWKLDRACSEKYEPILADLGVGFIFRKAVDTAKTTLTISTTATHMNFNLQLWAFNIEEEFPLDGSWDVKPVPRSKKRRRRSPSQQGRGSNKSAR